MEDNPVSNNDGFGFAIFSLIVSILSLCSAASVLILKLTKISSDVVLVMTFVTLGLLILGLVLSLVSAKKTKYHKKLSMVSSIIGVVTLAILIINLFIN